MFGLCLGLGALIPNLKCINQRIVCFVFCIASFFVFFFRLALVIAALADPCDTKMDNPLKIPQFNEGLQLCLSSTDLVFRILIILINGVILIGHFIGLMTEDRMLCGMVLGAEVCFVIVFNI